MKPKKQVPVTDEGWLVEIAAAYEDAREAIPFGAALGEPFGETESSSRTSRGVEVSWHSPNSPQHEASNGSGFGELHCYS